MYLTYAAVDSIRAAFADRAGYLAYMDHPEAEAFYEYANALDELLHNPNWECAEDEWTGLCPIEALPPQPIITYEIMNVVEEGRRLVRADKEATDGAGQDWDLVDDTMPF
jgi:hypothetical protein